MSKTILSPVMTLNEWSDFFTAEEGESDWALCRSILRAYFEIPVGAKQIQIRAFDEPGPGRTRVKLVHYDSVTWSGVLIDSVREYIVNETQDAIKKVAGRRKTWYVDIYYWE